jgi:hypothetical protein
LRESADRTNCVFPAVDTLLRAFVNEPTAASEIFGRGDLDRFD